MTRARLGKRWKRVLVCGSIAAGSALAAWGLSGVGFFQQLQLKMLDSHFVARGSTPTRDIILVTIDQKSLDSISDLQLFWHPYYADTIRAAAMGGAKVLGLDVAFGVPVSKWEPGHDQEIAEAVSSVYSTMPVVCIYVPAMLAKQQEMGWIVPLNMLASALELSAYANLTVDADDFVRNQELYEIPVPGAPVARSFALRIAEKFLGVEAEFPDGGLVLGGEPVPVTKNRTIRINYAGPAGTFPRVPLVDVRDAYRAGKQAQLEEWFKGKAVLVGVDSIEDRRATPFFTVLSGPRWNTAGVEVHASTVHTLLTRQFLLPVPQWWRGLAMGLAAGATMIITLAFAPTVAAVVLFGLFAVIVITTHLLFRSGYLLSTFELLLACGICHLGAVIYRFFTAEKKSVLFHKAMALFVSREVADHLSEDESIGRTGTRKFVTVMFSDIRGFTAFCDGKDPALVVDLLNEYLERMVAIIVAHKGHVNKFIGDGILAVFSDNDEGCVPGDHPVRAVKCGIQMALAPGQFRTGIGIHSGATVLGNVGSSAKMEYTVLGDTVNLASRLESLNKEHKTSLLMSDATQALLEDKIPTVHLGSVPVRGQVQAVNLFTAEALAPAVAAKGNADA